MWYGMVGLVWVVWYGIWCILHFPPNRLVPGGGLSSLKEKGEPSDPACLMYEKTGEILTHRKSWARDNCLTSSDNATMY